MVTLISAWRRTQAFDRFSAFSNRGLVAAGLLLFLMQIHGFGHSINLDIFGFSSNSQTQVSASNTSASNTLGATLAEYDRAFEGRDVLALWNLFAEDIVVYEQGTQDIGRTNALGKHIGPDLLAFQQMAAEFADVQVLDLNGAAIRTRQFTVKGKLPNRFFLAKGYETQNWVVRDGSWKLIHMHWSFPES